MSANPVPPKYQSKDFLKTDFWRCARLGCAKERWVSYPGCERAPTPACHCWPAGIICNRPLPWPLYLAMKDTEAGSLPGCNLCSRLAELVPWLEQWHDEIDRRMASAWARTTWLCQRGGRALGFAVDELARLEAGRHCCKTWPKEGGSTS